MVTMAVQAAGIAIIATGMVLVIVVAQHRPVGRVARRPHRDELRAADDRLVPERLRHRRRTSRSSGSIALALGDRPRRRDRRPPGLHHRLHRRAVVHRHARRPAVDPRPRLVPVAAARRSPASTPTFQLIGGGAQGSIGGTLTWVLGDPRLRRDRRPALQRPPAAAALRLPGAADVGGGPARRSSAASPSSGSPGSPTTTSGRRASPTSIATEQHRDRRRRAAADPDRVPVPDRPAHRRDAGDDLHRHPAALRPLRLRLRRQPRRRRAGRHQHALDDPQDVRR